MDELARRFEDDRPHLRAVAYRMLGSFAEADDAVQEAWLRLQRVDADELRDLRAWLTTVVGRVCLDVLKARRAHPELSLSLPLPDPVVSDARTPTTPTPEDEAVRAESIALALLVVLDRLSPAERVAFVLHDLFAVPFEEIGRIVGRNRLAARQLASRARRRVRGSPAGSADSDPGRQRAVVAAFLAAAQGGDLGALVALLDPDVMLRADVGDPGPVVVRGAREVAERALSFRQRAATAELVLVNGGAGLRLRHAGRVAGALGFTVAQGQITEIYIYADPTRF
ncbi:sigma-70 family RNA polymerase sigma factor [Asanoa sp. WMMD1127]|uniref:sigma-70 family RNA polymerase sigma factor n=1 Tax=Asanoa sp. WMMD1127 TaxID=3016107 RepID=UPI00241741F0|nr:sigma-70 family RNA polymerase sigma factor [Asanoa sp. WMMD1127]MDG4821682.1 sigma-70 family RNA polymerase sigma factor [Asanoa sp. WMMD1127]